MQGFPLYNSEDRGIPLSERLLPSYLKALGYSTHLVGKWHVGMSRPEFLPTARGYDDHYGMRGGFVDYYTYNKVESVSKQFVCMRFVRSLSAAFVSVYCLFCFVPLTYIR